MTQRFRESGIYSLNSLVMRIFIALLIVATTTIFYSCDEDTPRTQTLIEANAILMTKDEIRTSIAIEPPTPINEAGKIYTYNDYVFVNDRGQGVHVIDNRDAVAPEKVAYLNIPGNYDIEVRNDILYADSYTDLVVFDIKEITDIHQVALSEDTFVDFSFSRATHTEEYDYENYDFAALEESVIVGWEYREVVIEIPESDDDILVLEDSNTNAGDGDVTGEGGSFARFKVVDDYLYVVDFANLYTFNIGGQYTVDLLGSQNIGWQIETIFNQDDYLYIGSANGMIIYDIENRAQPQYTSEIEHLTGCDPVVVSGDYAYLTLRGGNACGQLESILEVIDVSDRSNPFIVRDYAMNNPYGLGVKDNFLFVSDGRSGFNIYDRTNPTDLILINTLTEINVFDVIPLEDRLLAIAGNTLYQYYYQGTGLFLISSFEIN